MLYGVCCSSLGKEAIHLLERVTPETEWNPPPQTCLHPAGFGVFGWSRHSWAEMRAEMHMVPRSGPWSFQRWHQTAQEKVPRGFPRPHCPGVGGRRSICLPLRPSSLTQNHPLPQPSSWFPVPRGWGQAGGWGSSRGTVGVGSPGPRWSPPSGSQGPTTAGS